jgi:hypothetical protein
MGVGGPGRWMNVTQGILVPFRRVFVLHRAGTRDVLCNKCSVYYWTLLKFVGV